MAVRDLEAFIRQRGAIFDPNLDVNPGSPFDIKVIQPLVRRLGPDPFTVDLSTFVDARLTEAFPELATKEGDAVTDILNKPVTLLWDPIVREVKRVRDNLSYGDASRLTIEEAEALGGNLFAQPRNGDFARGVARIFFSQAQKQAVSPINFVTSRSGLHFFPTENQSIRMEEMLLNVSEDGLYYFDINVIAEAEGDKYNIERNSLVSIANVPAAVKVQNLRRFREGQDADTPTEFLNRTRSELTEKSLATLRGISSKLINSFPEVQRLNVVGFNDPEMQRDIIKGGGLGPVIAAGVNAFADDDLEGRPFTRRLRDNITTVASSIDETNPGSYVVTVFEAFDAGDPVVQDLTVKSVVDANAVDFEEQVMLLGAGGIPSIGNIITVAVASLVDGETFILDDGVNTPVTFEFDVAGDGVIVGSTAVDVSGLTTADEVKEAMIDAINGTSSPLLITARDGGTDRVDLRNDQAGVQGNVAITDTVVDAGFVPTGMTGGSGSVPLRWLLRKRTLTLSDIPGGILFPDGATGTVEIADDEIHIGGVTDIHVRGSGFDEATLVLDDVVDDVPELSGTAGSVELSGSDNVFVLGDIVLDSDYGVADDEFQLLKRAGRDNMTLRFLEGPDAGIYRIISVTQVSGQSPRVLTDPQPTTVSATGRRWRLFDQVNIELTDPKETLVTDEDLTTVQNSDVVGTLAGTDFDALGVAEDHTLRILEGPDAGDYNIVENPIAPSFTSLRISEPLTNSASGLRYVIFRSNAAGGLQLPFIRVTKVELLDSSNQPLGSEVPYAKPVDVQSRAFQNPARGVKHDIRDVSVGVVSRSSGVRSTGSITATIGVLDGETFTLDDGVNTATVFEFDDDASVSAGQIPVDITGLVTGSEVKSAIISAINDVGDSLRITASDGGGSVVLLVNDVGGAQGNVAITETVTDGSFAVTGMTGGVDDSFDFSVDTTLELTYVGLENTPSVVANVTFTAAVTTRESTLDQLNAQIFSAIGVPFAAIPLSGNRIGFRPLRAGLLVTGGNAIEEIFGDNEPHTSWDVRSASVDALGGWESLVPQIDFNSGIDVLQILEGNQVGYHPGPFLLDYDAGGTLDPSTALVVRDVSSATFVVEPGDTTFSPETELRVQIGARSIGSVRCYFLAPTSIEFDQDSRFTLTTDAGVLNFLPDPTLAYTYIPAPPNGTKPSDGSATGATDSFSSVSQDFIRSGTRVGDRMIIDYIPIEGTAALADPVPGLAGKTLIYSIDGGVDRVVTFIKDDATLATGEVTREGVINQINASIGEDVASITGSNTIEFSTERSFVVRKGGTANDDILLQRTGLPVTNRYKFSAFDQDNSSPHAGTYTITAVFTSTLEFTPSLPDSGDFSDPVTSQQYSLERLGGQRTSTTEMNNNEAEADLYFFDVELVSEGTGDQYNIDAGEQLTVSGYRSDGWFLTVDDENLTFSPSEQPRMIISKSILEQGVDDSPLNSSQIVGSNLQVTYDRSQLTDDVNNYITSEIERVVCESPLGRHLIPHFVRFDLAYVGGSNTDVIASDLEELIRDLFPQDALESSDIQKAVSDRGATSITNPLDLIAIVHNVDRSITAARSQNALTTGRLAAFIPDVINLTRNV